MPRPLRIEFENAWYHVMNRGAGRRLIYKKEAHREMFLLLLSEVKKLFDIEIHGYCLMSNHYHLLIKTPRPNLSRAMRHLDGVYTQRYNRMEKTDGPLFRGRYKAIIVSFDDYLLQVSRYIHLNPVAAKIIKKPEQSAWSSCYYYLHPKNKPAWLNVEEILSLFGSKNTVAYQQFLNEGIDDLTKNFYQRKSIPVILGTSQFKENILRTLPEDKIKASKSDYKRVKLLPTIEDVVTIVATHFKIHKSLLYVAKRGKKNEARNVAIYGSRIWAQKTLESISTHFFCRSLSMVSNVINRLEVRMQSNNKIKKDIEKIQSLLASEMCHVNT